MGNCQAIDAATIVIQHPCGKEDKLYWPVYASEVMQMNPGHYVALLISTSLYPSNNNNNNNNNDNNNNSSVRLTRIKLLRPTDSLVLGQVYRLITSQEVMNGMRAKKYAKKRTNQSESAEQPGMGLETTGRSELQKDNYQVIIKHGRHQPRTAASANSATARSRTWQPSLKTISEAAS